MKGKVHFVVNEGNVVYATNNQKAAEYRALNSHSDAINDKVNECGRDIDDLTDEEFAEFSFAAGYDGGYYYVDSVNVPEEYDSYDEIETCEGDIVTYNDIESAYEENYEF